jgi:alkylation response protein AidB-like acyl-CoA dehydrogenase
VWLFIGMADGAVRDFERQLLGRTNMRGENLAESPSIQVLLSESSIDLACAFALARQNLAFVIERGRREEPLTDLEITRIRAHQAYLARLTVRATNRLFEVSGAHGLLETSAIQRFHRDVNAGSHQAALTWHSTAEEYARRRLAAV